MRFFKVLVFLLFVLCSLNVFALTNQQRAYLINEKGYSAQEVANYEKGVKQRQEDVRAGRTPSALTEADKKIINDAKAPEAITYGNENPGMLDRLGAWFAEATGMADHDMTGVMDTLDTLGEISTDIGIIALTGAAGLGIGGLAAATTFTAGWIYENWLYGDDNIIFNKIMRAFSSIDNGCWFCGIFEKLFNAVNAFAAAISDNMAGAFTKLLWIFLLFYILFKVLKAVISFGEINPKEFLTDLFMPLLKTAMAIIVLYNMSFFYEYVVSPLAELSIGFSINMQETGRENINGVGQIRHITREGGTTTEENICSRITSSSTEGSGLRPEVNFAIQCFLRTISTQLIQDMAVGATFVAASWKVDHVSIFPNWSMLFIGIVMFLGCFFIFLSFPFKLLDGLFKLMFVCGLMPLWVILWVLPATREYSGKAFKMFLDVLITFICLSVIMMMVSIILYNALPEDFPEVVRLMARGEDKEALAKIDWSTGNFFMFVAMMFLALELLKQTDSFVSQFAGGSLGIGAGLEGWGRAGAQLVGTKVAKPIATNVAKGTGKLVGAGLEKGWEGAKAAAKKTPYAAGYALGAAKRGLRNLNSGPKMSATQAMMPTGMLPTNPTGGGSDGGTPPPGGSGGGSGGGTPPSGSEGSSGNSFSTSEEAKKAMEQIRTASPESLKTLLDNPAALGTIISAVSGGAVNPALATAGVKVVDSVVKETLSNGHVKETKVSQFKDVNDKLVRETVESVIKDQTGNLVSTLSRHELVDPETNKRSGIEIERDVDGKLTNFMKEVKDETGRLVEQVKVDVKTGTMTDMLKPKP